jgi:hypothetical protein
MFRKARNISTMGTFAQSLDSEISTRNIFFKGTLEGFGIFPKHMEIEE